MVLKLHTLVLTLFAIVVLALLGRAMVQPARAQDSANISAPRAAQQSERPSVAVPPEIVPRATPGSFSDVPLQSVRPPVGAARGGARDAPPLLPLGSTPGGVPRRAANAPGVPGVAGADGTPNANAENAAIWRAIREGGRGSVAGGNERSGFLMITGGQNWRAFRNGPLATWSAVVILATIGLLALFFALRGRMAMAHGPSHRRIKRFNWFERMSHWTLAISFILLALTGFNLLFGRALLLPLIGPEAFSTMTLAGKWIHNYVSFAFMIALALVAVLWILENIPNRHDLKWLARGGGMIGKEHPPARKFNAGQKIIFWVTVIAGISISLSGWALLNPFETSMFSDTFAGINGVFGTGLPTGLTALEEQQYQAAWHAIVAVFMSVVVIAHIYIGTVGMEGALDAMTRGDVDANWAKEHHSLWVDEIDMEEGIRRRNEDVGLAAAH